MPDVPAPPRVVVIGAGRAGRSLAVALETAGLPVLAVLGRERPFPDALARADIVLVATPDGVVGSVLRELGDAPLAPGAIVLQLSGARAPDGADDALRAQGGKVGSFHPLVPLADPAVGAERLRGAWIGISGDGVAVAAGASLARRLGAQALTIPETPDARALYHAAAVFASNFPVVLAAVAERLFVSAGVQPASAGAAVRHLLASAVANVVVSTHVAEALTGPIVRGDLATVERHLAALDADVAARALYQALARATVDVAQTAGRVNADTARALDRVLGSGTTCQTAAD